MPPVVSVVMPVYDPHPVYFRQALDSILGQTLSDLELIIVEDPSPRSAAELLADRNDPRVRHLVRSQKGTLVQSLNWGLTESRASWIARADADDICEPNRLEKQFAYLHEHPQIDVLGTQLTVINDAGEVTGYRTYPVEHETILRCLRRYNALAHPSVLFRKEPVLAAGGYRPYFVEDYELWSRLAQHNIRFANHPERLVRYRVIAEGIRSAKVRDTLRGTLEVKRLYWRERMDLGSRFRAWAEQLLLWLPPQFVLSLFLKTQLGSARGAVGR